MFRRRFMFAALLLAVLAEAGCRHAPCRRDPVKPRPLGDPNALGEPIPPRVIPLESIPPTGVPSTPRPSNYPPAGGSTQRDYLPGPAPGVLGEPIAPVERTERLRPVPQPPLEVPTQPKLLTPVPLPGEVPDRPAPAPPRTERKDLPPPVAEKVPEKPSEKLALELPGFATVLDRVTASRKPTTDGFAWLKTNGYKTVAYLHDPDAKDVDSARQLTEKQGLKFVAIPVSPETLPAAYRTFAELVKDASARPLHAFATSGNRAGSLWYLVFREVESLSDDAARVRAGKLGLERPEDSDEAKRFWLAVQQFLSKQ